MSIYTYDTEQVSEQLTPPLLRRTKALAWLYTLTSQVQWLWALVFEDYKDGSVYAEYDNSTTYNRLDRVVYIDNKVYECLVNSSLGVNPLNTTNWVKINDNYMGAIERIKYNYQIILLERALNRWFRNYTGSNDQIYITTNQITNQIFVMGFNGSVSSPMALNSPFTTTYMGLNPNFAVQYNMTINVPLALFNTLGSTAQDRENAIRIIANKYILAGITYEVVTY
jgi:hypothetical protein